MFAADTARMVAAHATADTGQGAERLAWLTAHQLAELGRRARACSAPWVSVTVPVPAVDPLEALEGDDDAVLLLRASGDFDLGLGSAASVTAAGVERFAVVRRRAESILAAVETVSSGPPRAPRLLGGFAFSPHQGPVADLPNAWWILPRLWLRSDRLGSTLTVTLGPGDDLEEMLRGAGERLRPRTTGVMEPRRLHRSPPDIDGWSREIERVLTAIADGEVTKVVCARPTTVTTERPPVVGRVLSRVGSPGALRYAVRHRGVTLFGASPERLVELRGRAVSTEALAGTAAQGIRAAARLAASSKERHEHAIVRDAICAGLSSWCDHIVVAPRPEVSGMGQLQHLRSPIRAVTRAREHVLELAAHLHPTPAVGGAPTPAALSLLDDFATGRRGWYAGAVGSFEASGDGELHVALRCAIARGSSVELWAGAGIVAGSDPEREYRELELKQQTILRALQPPMLDSARATVGSASPRRPAFLARISTGDRR